MILLTNILCGLLLTCATLVVQSVNPIFSVLYLVLVFFNASGLVLLQGHDYMACLLIILYVGAMCTFFLFAIMILDIRLEESSEKKLKQFPINLIINILLIGLLKPICDGYSSLWLWLPKHLFKEIVNPLSITLVDYSTQINSLGCVLYTVFGFHLIVSSLILLSAMLGCIVLTFFKTKESSKSAQEQNLRDFKRTVNKSTN